MRGRTRRRLSPSHCPNGPPRGPAPAGPPPRPSARPLQPPPALPGGPPCSTISSDYPCSTAPRRRCGHCAGRNRSQRPIICGLHPPPVGTRRLCTFLTRPAPQSFCTEDRADAKQVLEPRLRCLGHRNRTAGQETRNLRSVGPRYVMRAVREDVHQGPGARPSPCHPTAKLSPLGGGQPADPSGREGGHAAIRKPRVLRRSRRACLIGRFTRSAAMRARR